MEDHYTKALFLYNQGDYEGALNVLNASTVHSKEEDALKNECKNQIVRQYIYLIKDALSQSDYQEARKWKEEYISKYGYNETIDSIEIPAIKTLDPPEEKEKQSIEEEVLPEEKQNVEVEKVERIASTENVNTEKAQITVQSKKKSTGKKTLWIILTIVIVIIGIVGGEIVTDKIYKGKIEARLNEITSKEGVHVIVVLNNIVYYKEDGKPTYSKYNLETGQTEVKELFLEDVSYISEAYYAETRNCIIFIGNTGNFYKMNISHVCKLDLATGELKHILSGEKVKHSMDYFITTNRELIVKGDCAANDAFYSYDQYYDYDGNLIDGKTIRGRGYIGGIYPIEMGFHCLKGKAMGWYKYEGHTNYMTLDGSIQENNSFVLTEYNEKGESFGTFYGYADFNQKKLSGIWKNGETQLNFVIGEAQMNMKEKYQSELKDLVLYWNKLHTNQLTNSTSLECLYAPEVLFYGQTLSPKDCVTRIIQTMKKYKSFSQSLENDIQYTKIDNHTIRCDFTKRVQTNGKYANYSAYLIFRQEGNDWLIITESDTQTDAYFERLNKK